MSKNFFEYLKFEHEKIDKVLRAFKTFIFSIGDNKDFDEKNFRDFILFFKLYADKIHHGKEEDILFPQAYDNGLGHKSGSRCTFFFGQFLDNNYLNEIKVDLRGYEPQIPTYLPNPALSEIIANKSPLVIPLEEHEIGFYSMQIMASELDKKNRSGWNPELLLKTARRYANMLESHIKKEDECLFPLLVKNFNSEKASQLVTSFEAFDRRHSEWHEQADEIYKKLVVDDEAQFKL